MRGARMRATVLAVVMAAVAGGGAGAGASDRDGVAPTGITVHCTASAPYGAPAKSGGVLWATARGTCSVTGSLGAPWELLVIVRLQAKVSGRWRTRAIGTASIENYAGTKTLRRVQAGLRCGGSVTRTWRVSVTAKAQVNEKTTSVLASHSTTSATSSVRC